MSVTLLLTSLLLAQSATGADAIIGRWDVSLFYAPDQPPSTTVMVVESIGDGGELTGSFYGSSFEEGRAIVFEDVVVWTATTSDGTGPYVHSGRLVDGRIQGQTLSVGRGFLMAWRAERSASTQTKDAQVQNENENR